MTKEEKQERRLAKRKLRQAVERNHFHQFKFGATRNQLKQEAKRVADQLLAGRTPNTATTIRFRNTGDARV